MKYIILGTVNGLNWISNKRWRRLYHGLIPTEYVDDIPYCSELLFNAGCIYYPDVLEYEKKHRDTVIRTDSGRYIQGHDMYDDPR
tara:strand:- start:353 stop:607 length:255 start_codon:yes stop_codon:yes gene_type:complete